MSIRSNKIQFMESLEPGDRRCYTLNVDSLFSIDINLQVMSS